MNSMQFNLKLTFYLNENKFNQIKQKIHYLYDNHTLESIKFLIKKKEKKFTLIKSPHVYNKSKETFIKRNYLYIILIEGKIKKIRFSYLLNSISMMPYLKETKLKINK